MSDPRARLVLLALVGLLALFLENAEALLVLAASSAMGLLLTRPGWRRALAGGGLVVGIVWSTVVGQALFYPELPRTPILHVGPLTLYEEGIVHGLRQSLRFVAVALAGLAVASSTPPDRLFAALVGLRVPFGLALMVATAIRFLPELLAAFTIVRRARAHRGRPAWRRSPWAWLLLELALLRPIIARAWRRAQNLAETLDTRGFDPTALRRQRHPLVLGAADRVVVIAATAVTIAVGTLRLTFLLYATDVVYFPELRALYGFVRDWL